MLYMEISSWEPANRDKILEHFKELKVPAGIKIVNQWVDLTGGRYFILYECDDAEAFAAFNLPWSDVCYIDCVPVMKSTDFMSAMSRKS
ncbi:DUF3303 domain-containing protein [Methanococcoides sp. FTZ1]|uniref:DUF3303 domain-containing protein n=1 Tax=Methanococcoides sp. FTZ1 TaxID=3439061 RepID=UPI003F874B34